MNKINTDSNKIYLEFISYEQPLYYNDQVKEMFQSVNEIHYFFANETAVTPKEKKTFTLTIKFRDRYTVINFGNLHDDKNYNVDNAVVNEGASKAKEPTSNEEEEEEQIHDISENIFNKVKLSCDSYNYFISSIGETLETTPYEDFVDFVVDAKLKYGALIITEYGDYVDYFSDKETMTLLNKLYLITDIFLFDAKEALSNFKKHYEILTKENSKKVYKFGEIQVNNYPFGNVSGKQLESEKHEENNENNNNEQAENKGENQNEDKKDYKDKVNTEEGKEKNENDIKDENKDKEKDKDDKENKDKKEEEKKE
jgi:hypothetical protein